MSNRTEPPPIFDRFGSDVLSWDALTDDQRQAWWDLQEEAQPPLA